MYARRLIAIFTRAVQKERSENLRPRYFQPRYRLQLTAIIKGPNVTYFQNIINLSFYK